MQAGNEVFPAAKWIRARIGNLGGSISGAYLDLIPAEVALPAVRYHVQTPSDKSEVAGERILVTIDWLIVVVNKGLSVAAIVPIAAALDVALHQQGGVADGYKIDCTRREPFSMIEPDDSGVQYRHAGGIYRTIVGPT